jgi:hypothetical protein
MRDTFASYGQHSGLAKLVEVHSAGVAISRPKFPLKQSDSRFLVHRGLQEEELRSVDLKLRQWRIPSADDDKEAAKKRLKPRRCGPVTQRSRPGSSARYSCTREEELWEAQRATLTSRKRRPNAQPGHTYPKTR